MKLLIDVSNMNVMSMHEHQIWIVDADAKMSAVLEAAGKASYLADVIRTRIINTREATDVDIRTHKVLPMAANEAAADA